MPSPLLDVDDVRASAAAHLPLPGSGAPTIGSTGCRLWGYACQRPAWRSMPTKRTGSQIGELSMPEHRAEGNVTVPGDLGARGSAPW